MKTKICSSVNGCGKTKPVEEFARYSTGTRTLRAICKQCSCLEAKNNRDKVEKTPRTKTREFGIGDAAKDMFSRKLAGAR